MLPRAAPIDAMSTVLALGEIHAVAMIKQQRPHLWSLFGNHNGCGYGVWFRVDS
jgi:hypothetical protein